jgi:ATP-binding cassette subfamily F protein 3
LCGITEGELDLEAQLVIVTQDIPGQAAIAAEEIDMCLFARGLLLLDDHTNLLDLATRESLSIALNEFEGTVLLVSHDRALLREVCDEFWLVTRGGVQAFDGDLDDYQRWLLEVSRAVARGAEPPAVPGSTAAAAPAPAARPAPPYGQTRAAAPPAVQPGASGARKDERKQAADRRQQAASLTRPLRVELQQIDGRLERLAAERTELETQLSAPGLAPEAIADAGRRLNHVQAEVSVLEERWLELQEQLEALNAQRG